VGSEEKPGFLLGGIIPDMTYLLKTTRGER